jgi:excisionase family DNA binding protein
VGIDTSLSSVSAHAGGRLGPPHVIGETTLLTFKEAMDFLRVSRSTVYRLMWSGQLRGHKVGSTWRFYRSDLLEAVASPVYDPSAKRDTHVPEGRD